MDPIALFCSCLNRASTQVEQRPAYPPQQIIIPRLLAESGFTDQDHCFNKHSLLVSLYVTLITLVSMRLYFQLN
jgi:hypothetical protein